MSEVFGCEVCGHLPHAGYCFVCGCKGWAILADEAKEKSVNEDNSKPRHEIAKEKIEEILRELIQEESGGEEFLTDYVILAAAHVETPGENRGTTSYRRLMRDGQAPHNTLGLLENELVNYKMHMNHHFGQDC